MYPDTDSPPSRVTRERVDRLKRGLSRRPWEREAAYASVGVPRLTIHYLIRRNGAALVDLVVASAGVDLRQACFFFGERWKGLRRSGVQLEAIPPERWCEFFRTLRERPALWGAWKRIVRKMIALPTARVLDIASLEGLGEAPAGWRALVDDAARTAARDVRGDDPGRLRRLLLGRAMRTLRGKVSATEVLESLEESAVARRNHERR
jgi:Glu-tRNA(Gln) amidotransferase subunit E-like FAD-binding protein